MDFPGCHDTAGADPHHRCGRHDAQPFPRTPDRVRRLPRSLRVPGRTCPVSAEHWIGIWGEALYAGLILAFAQGMELLRAASERYAYHLDLSTVARIWRGGCIIRAALLGPISAVFREEPGRRNLILDPKMADVLNRRQDALRQATAAAVQTGVPVPAYAAGPRVFRRLPSHLAARKPGAGPAGFLRLPPLRARGCGRHLPYRLGWGMTRDAPPSKPVQGLEPRPKAGWRVL